MADDVELATTEKDIAACDCANIKKILRSEFKCSNFCFSHPTPHLLTTCQWGFSALAYMRWRIFWAALYTLVCTYLVVNKAIIYPPLQAIWFFYLSTWAFLLLTANTIVQASVVAYVVLRNISTGRHTPWFLRVTWSLYILSTDLYLEAAVLYLCLAILGKSSVAMAVTFLTNSVYVLVDMALTATPVRLLHFVYPVGLYCLYITATQMFWAAGGTTERGDPYAYPLLDLMLSKGSASLGVVWMLCGAPVVHLVVWTFYVLKMWAHDKRQIRSEW